LALLILNINLDVSTSYNSFELEWIEGRGSAEESNEGEEKRRGGILKTMEEG